MKNIAKAFVLVIICYLTYNTLTFNKKEQLETSLSYLDGHSYKEETVLEYQEERQYKTATINEYRTDTESTVEEKTIITEEKTIVPKEKEEKTIVPEEKVTETNNISIIETIIGNMSGYGPDCYGCTSNKTASGYYVGEGNIYYNDSTYGNVRILSGDSKYPFGTIVKISNFNNQDPFYAIILDRGGAVGLDKRIQFDLLYEKEADAIPYGIKTSITFDIIRIGY